MVLTCCLRIEIGPLKKRLEQTRSLFQATRKTANMFDTPRWTRALERGVRIGTNSEQSNIPKKKLTNFFLTIARTFEKSREFRVGIGTNSNCYLGTNSNSYLGTNSLVVAWAQILRNSCLGTKLENRIFIGSVCWFCLVN